MGGASGTTRWLVVTGKAKFSGSQLKTVVVLPSDQAHLARETHSILLSECAAFDHERLSHNVLLHVLAGCDEGTRSVERQAHASLSLPQKVIQ